MSESVIYRYQCCKMGWLPAETATPELLRTEVRAHRDESHSGRPGSGEQLYVAPASNPDSTRPMTRLERVRLRV